MAIIELEDCIAWIDESIEKIQEKSSLVDDAVGEVVSELFRMNMTINEMMHEVKKTEKKLWELEYNG